MRILILGATGLVGLPLLNLLASESGIECFGSIRLMPGISPQHFHPKAQLASVKDLSNPEELSTLIDGCSPNIVFNCLSLQNFNNQTFESVIATYALIPKYLARLAAIKQFRVIHISSDGVFSGKAGRPYSESCLPDPEDGYGKAKLLGEIESKEVLNIRTSFIGFDPIKGSGLLEWFLRQKRCSLFKRSIFSGLPANRFAEIVRDQIIIDSSLSGTYHLSSNPVSKLDCLSFVSEALGLDMDIEIVDGPSINRSLSSEKFAKHCGYRMQDWSELSLKLVEARHIKYDRHSF